MSSQSRSKVDNFILRSSKMDQIPRHSFRTTIYWNFKLGISDKYYLANATNWVYFYWNTAPSCQSRSKVDNLNLRSSKMDQNPRHSLRTAICGNFKLGISDKYHLVDATNQVVLYWNTVPSCQSRSKLIISFCAVLKWTKFRVTVWEWLFVEISNLVFLILPWRHPIDLLVHVI